MDGELEVNASKFLLKRMAADKSLSQTWSNYHLIKSCLQKETQEPLVIDIANRVSRQLTYEQKGYQQQTTTPKKVQVNRWLKPVMGVGIAASVAFMSIFMLQTQGIENSHESILNTAKVHINTTKSIIEPDISATMAASSKTLLPPPYLSRFPSTSSGYSGSYNQSFSHNLNTPYLILINQSVQTTNNQLSPLLIKNISD